MYARNRGASFIVLIKSSMFALRVYIKYKSFERTNNTNKWLKSLCFFVTIIFRITNVTTYSFTKFYNTNITDSTTVQIEADVACSYMRTNKILVYIYCK